MRIVVTICFFLATIFSASKPDYIIEPGKRIGKISLSDTRTRVIKVLGRPKKQVLLGDKIRNDYWESVSRDTVDIYYRDDKVIQISISSPAYKINNTIGTNTSFLDIKEAFNKLERYRYFIDLSEERGNSNAQGQLFYTYYDDVERGLAFVFIYERDGKVPDEGVPSNIIIHLPGEALFHEQYEHYIDEENDDSTPKAASAYH
ncbi:MAG: hypothetical protein AB1489_20530 [Acidobacteriota bacterium]